jgi:hypothetical protein
MKAISTLPLLILSIAFTYCGSSEPTEIKNETSPHKDSIVPIVIADSIKKDAITPLIDYTGTYKLRVTRYREFIWDHFIELEQTGDSVSGDYRVTFTTRNKEKITVLNTTVKGKVTDNADINSGSTLEIQINERDVDSLLLKANPEAEYMIDKFIGSMLSLKFLVKENTIKNNYAGGEWDVWRRSN